MSEWLKTLPVISGCRNLSQSSEVQQRCDNCGLSDLWLGDSWVHLLLVSKKILHIILNTTITNVFRYFLLVLCFFYAMRYSIEFAWYFMCDVCLYFYWHLDCCLLIVTYNFIQMIYYVSIIYWKFYIVEVKFTLNVGIKFKGTIIYILLKLKGHKESFHHKENNHNVHVFKTEHWPQQCRGDLIIIYT